MRKASPRARCWWLMSVLLFTAGAAARVTGAWHYRFTTDPDCGVVALMAKHIAEGRDLRVFFYGQPYMGSPEPATSALFCKLFGVSGFWVCMGTAVCGILCLLLIYLWARDAAGPAAGKESCVRRTEQG